MDWRGYFLSGGFTSVGERRHCRVVVFVDLMNMFEDFRRAFCSEPYGSRDGQFDPMKLATMLVQRGPDFESWSLEQVRVYGGRYNPEREPYAAKAHDRQEATWRASGVVPRFRPLQYPLGWPTQKSRQKGVDVELAIDVVTMARVEYDIGIVVSTDTDLAPALEAVDRLRGMDATPRTCVIGYEGLMKQLRIAPRSPYCFRLSRADYESVHDPTDYTASSSAGSPRSTS